MKKVKIAIAAILYIISLSICIVFNEYLYLKLHRTYDMKYSIVSTISEIAIFLISGVMIWLSNKFINSFVYDIIIISISVLLLLAYFLILFHLNNELIITLISIFLGNSAISLIYKLKRNRF